MDGYSGSPPDTGVAIQLQPLINPLWKESLRQKGIETKTLEQILTIIEEESAVSLASPLLCVHYHFLLLECMVELY